jgi:uncharacterized protein
MIKKTQHFRIPVDSQTSLHAYVAQPSTDLQKRTVFIFSHGFHANGIESCRSFMSFSMNLIKIGYPTILFDYRGNGYSDLAFENMTFDTLWTDLNIITDFAHKKFPNHQVAYWGVSLGSALSAYTASKRQDVSLLVLWSLSAGLYNRYHKRFGPEIQERGYVYTSRGFRVNLAFLESLRDRNIYAAIRDSLAPTLLVHGNADSTAPVELSQTAHKLAPENTTLHEIAGGNHGFNHQSIQHIEALNITLNWITEHAK